MNLNTLKGLGEKRAKILNEQGVVSIETLVLNVPKTYDHHKIESSSNIEPRYFEATVMSEPKIAFIRKNLKKLTCKVTVDHKEFTLSLFNQIHWKRHLTKGVQIVIYGTLDGQVKAQKIFLKHSFIEGIIPRYKIKGIPDKTLQKWLHEAFDSMTFKENIDEVFINKYDLLDLKQMYKTLHFPKDLKSLNQAFYSQKVRFLMDYLTQRSPVKTHVIKPKKTIDSKKLSHRLKKLPFELTNAQKDALNEGLNDLSQGNLSRRLYQGDTGSGKTVVALLLSLFALDHQLQVAFMAPTEVLASQHYQTYKTLFKDEPYQVSYLSGGLDSPKVKVIQNDLKNQKIDLIFGTHALFSNAVSFKNLGLVIIDEEQRFGVKQKQKLLKKGIHADYIALSATPIPRTLALTLYQDMEVTTITGMPKNRKRVKTEVIPLKDAKFLDPMIDLTLKDDKQVFVIAPRIEDDDALLSIERIESYYKKTFKNARIKTLHGKMEASIKNDILKSFRDQKIDILISTTVIEVGIDIPSATLMLIYHAERFGYSQLHQLRGRLGRHHYEGVCYLLYKGNAAVKERLSLLKTVQDGFELSRIDLEERGFGSLFGDTQSGFLESSRWPYQETLELLASLKQDLLPK